MFCKVEKGVQPPGPKYLTKTMTLAL